MSFKNTAGEFLEEIRVCRKQLDQRAKQARSASELQLILKEIDFIRDIIARFRSAQTRTADFKYRLN
ncbi:MAG: hypothetical protein LBT81_05900 [Helicobacteraceae bacterium]|jgi:hypothetical protein|nr:hypothetical protein [Helicobacteraceae bacterium]